MIDISEYVQNGEKIMKKIIVVLLAIGLLLSVAAFASCNNEGDKEDPTTEVTTDNAEVTTAPDETTAEPDETTGGEEESTTAETTAAKTTTAEEPAVTDPYDDEHWTPNF